MTSNSALIPRSAFASPPSVVGTSAAAYLPAYVAAVPAFSRRPRFSGASRLPGEPTFIQDLKCHELAAIFLATYIYDIRAAPTISTVAGVAPVSRISATATVVWTILAAKNTTARIGATLSPSTIAPASTVPARPAVDPTKLQDHSAWVDVNQFHLGSRSRSTRKSTRW